jgi:hypothetical protein
MDPVPTTNNKIKILPPGEPVVVRGIVSSVVVFFFIQRVENRTIPLRQDAKADIHHVNGYAPQFHIRHQHNSQWLF